MATSHAIHHQLLRPSVLHILRAAGYHSTKPSVLDALTDIAARHLTLLATSTVRHSSTNHPDSLELLVEDMRMAMQDCGVLNPERVLEDQAWGTSEAEDTRGVDAFIEWARGRENKEIMRVATDGEEGVTDYLTGKSCTGRTSMLIVQY
jgi:transcription initiation factor TFIID subunit 3